MLLTQTVQSGDWKNEKHVPELEYKDTKSSWRI